MPDFASIVGPDHVTETASILTVSPASTDETAAVMRLCAERKLVVSPRGGDTKLNWGNPVTPQVILDTRRLAGVREHSWQDLTATVGAGTTWEAMECNLAQHGQRVALDPLFASTATVGGIIAVNDSGALRMRYGSLRDLVIGMTIVLSDGTIARSGGKVVKNVAGYDLPKLLTGSFGTLGIITEVTFRLHPVQATSETWTVPSDDIHVLAELQRNLTTAAMSIESLQTRTDEDGFALDVRFASLPEVLREHEQRLREVSGGLTTSPSTHDVWQTREHLFKRPGATILKITALPNKVGAILQGFKSLLQNSTVACVADATGIITVALAAAPTQIVAIIHDLRARLRGDGGMVVILRAAPDIPGDIDRWGGSPPAIAVMRAVKQQFDPERLLNPGKFVGGI
ncbi:MAG TPA: FAD-binding oxidoreductase [Acidobacteriaceae bacterium]|nr:FAD-binding oxidoreductase [Acidobacteriaceae bacterium]